MESLGAHPTVCCLYTSAKTRLNFFLFFDTCGKLHHEEIEKRKHTYRVREKFETIFGCLGMSR